MFRTLTPIVAILMAVVVYFYYIQPTMDEIQDIEGETDEYVEAVRNAEQFNTRLQTLVQKKNSFSAFEIERLNALVPDTVDEVKLLVDLKEVARAHGMLFGNISVSENEDTGGSGEISEGSTLDFERDFVYSDIQFGLIGTYEQFRGALAEIERSLVLLEVVNISFSASEGDLQQYKITARAYALKPFSL